MTDSGRRARERRRFRRVDIRYPVRIETAARSKAAATVLAEGATVNLSFGGALLGVDDSAALEGATRVVIRFVEKDRVAPAALPAVIWRLDDGDEGHGVAVEFDQPLISFDGSIELEERVAWLRRMGGEQLLGDTIKRFLDNVPDGIRKAREAHGLQDLEGVAQISAALKTNASSVGAVSLYEIARRAERAARAGDAATAWRYVESLDGYFRIVRARLERFI